jgi:hypothetical protein
MINRPLQRGFEKYPFNQGKRYATKEYCQKNSISYQRRGEEYAICNAEYIMN